MQKSWFCGCAALMCGVAVPFRQIALKLLSLRLD